MSKQNLNYEDGIPEEILWNPETNSFMKRSLFPGKWIPARISVWDADNPKYQYRPGRDRTYQEAMKSISGNSIPGDRSERQDYRDSRGNFSLSMLSEGDRTKDRPDTGNAGQSSAREAAQVPLSQDNKKSENNDLLAIWHWRSHRCEPSSFSLKLGGKTPQKQKSQQNSRL